MAYHRATHGEINLDAFRQNLAGLRLVLGSGVNVMAIVKADAYGHGAIACAKAALEGGAAFLGVGIIEEGIELRESGIQVPILVMGGIFPNEAPDLLQYNLASTVSTESLVQTISKEASRKNKLASVHIKIDTGMTRLGVSMENLLNLAGKIRDCGNLQIDGVCTHFSSADEEDNTFTLQQLSQFKIALHQLEQAGIKPPQVHCANSAATIKYPESRFNLVRPGLMLYGALPSPTLKPYIEPFTVYGNGSSLTPVMQWKSKIIHIKRTTKGTALSYGRKNVAKKDILVAIIPIGYADGLSRSLSGKLQVIVRGKKVPQVGAICMDMTLIDVTNLPSVDVEDEVVIFGKQGNQSIRVEEIAALSGTIPYETLCAVGKRLPRVYNV